MDTRAWVQGVSSIDMSPGHKPTSDIRRSRPLNKRTVLLLFAGANGFVIGLEAASLQAPAYVRKTRTASPCSS